MFMSNISLIFQSCAHMQLAEGIVIERSTEYASVSLHWSVTESRAASS